MTWFVWRQYRLQAAIAGALLAAFAAVFIATWPSMASHWHSALTACTANRSCGSLRSTLLLTNSFAHDLTFFSLMVPALLGLFWGAPLVAGEFESGTASFVWAQGISRTRWLLAKAGWLLVAAAVWGGVVSALVTWWSGPPNALYEDAFQFNEFDMQGIVPIGYAVFATALGIAAGAVLRRTVPAIAVTIAGFIVIRLVVAQDLRTHYLGALTHYFAITASWSPPGAAWILNSGAIDKAGHIVAIPQNGAVQLLDGVLPASALPAACQKLLPSPGSGAAPGSQSALASCIRSAGFRQFVTYQPANRFWPFQGIELGVFLTMAAVLLAIAIVAVRRRDA